MIRVTEIAFTGYPVTDMPRARAFYEGVLKLKPTMNIEQDGKCWIEYDIGAGTLGITNMWAEWKPSTSGGCATLEVEDFNEAMAELRAASVKFQLEPTESPGCHFALVEDSEGNSLGIHKRKA